MGDYIRREVKIIKQDKNILRIMDAGTMLSHRLYKEPSKNKNI
jgi:hypothetical protein